MSARFFLDTNVLVYVLERTLTSSGIAPASNELEANRKASISIALIQQHALCLGVQVFNELSNVARKRRFDWPKTKLLLVRLESLCQVVVPLSLDIHKRGLLLHEKHHFQFYDALLLAAALKARCRTFYSEDMQHGQLVEGSMTILNPFKI